MRKLVLLLAVFLPSGLKAALYRRCFGWTIGTEVHIGLSLIDVESVEIGDGVRIGHFNRFRNVRKLQVGSGSYIANFNEVYGPGTSSTFPSVIVIGRNVMIMSHHFVDVAGIVTIEDRVTIGGRDTHVWSHTLTVGADGSDALKPLNVTIGTGAYVGARATFVGCAIPPGALVGAGSVVTRSIVPERDDCRVLIAGNPATIRKTYPRQTGLAQG